MTTVLWTSYNDPETLVNVGLDAMAMLCDNIICFYNLRTKARHYYKGDSATTGCGISKLAGHNRFPLFAFVEKVLRPMIHVLTYPTMTKCNTFSSERIPTFVDIRFSEFEYLIALGGYPTYILRVWNIRQNKFIAELEAKIKSSEFCLYHSANNIPIIVQFSKWTKELIFYELCFTAETNSIHEVARIAVSKDHAKSTVFSMCFGEDGVFYLVNDFGIVSSVDVAQFFIKREWGTSYESNAPPRSHNLYGHRNGFLVANSDNVYFIHKGERYWSVDWVVESFDHGIVKIVCNFYGEIYAAIAQGNLCRFNVKDRYGELVELLAGNCSVEDYALVKGVKEENIVLLSNKGDLLAIDIGKNLLFSTLTLEGAICIVAHNTGPYVAVGTNSGKIHFISYDKVRCPVMLATVDVDKYAISQIRFVDYVLLASNIYLEFHQMTVDVKRGIYVVTLTLPVSDKQRVVRLLDFHLIDETYSFAFGSSEAADDTCAICAEELWVFNWSHADFTITITVFTLPESYRAFWVMPNQNKDAMEIYAAPVNTNAFDCFTLCRDDTLTLNMRLRTHHFSCITGIGGARNMLTWGQGGSFLHFRIHKRSPLPYVIARRLHLSYVPRVLKKSEDCYNAKYQIFLHHNGCLKVYKLPSTLMDMLKENITVDKPLLVIEPSAIEVHRALQDKSHIIVRVVTPADVENRTLMDKLIKELSQAVRELIDYDISVTGKKKGVFRKFCLNYKWLDQLNEQAKILCDVERKSLLDSIADQTRIRDWILNLVTCTTSSISIKIRAIFSNSVFENYSMPKWLPYEAEALDYYRFHDMDDFEGEEDEDEDQEDVMDAAEVAKSAKPLKTYIIRGHVYDHMMSEHLRVQDMTVNSINQICNEKAKFKYIVSNAIKQDFNKKFLEIQQYKQEIMDNITSTNAKLSKIYDNMNCMLDLLHMETFVPPVLSVPTWMNDEILERIMTVDDSEIKAINRRKKKEAVTTYKGGRMLLWSREFWSNALNVMMDGVLEKLWEEEIKKTPPPPEFTYKKQVHEYSLEEQRAIRQYEDVLRVLMEDRKKYLRILNVNEGKTIELKNNYILKLNEKVAEMSVLKLKYDFAIKQYRLRLLNYEMNHFNRLEWRKLLTRLRNDVEKVNDYIGKYQYLIEFWEKSVEHTKSVFENLTTRDKAVDRQFKTTYLNSISPHTHHEIRKLFKRRPKQFAKTLNSTMICIEVAHKVMQKATQIPFPLPSEALEYLRNLEALDDARNTPPGIEAKHWDALVKLRRQKIENELRIRGCNFQLQDAQNSLNAFSVDLQELKNTKQSMQSQIDHTMAKYFDCVQNQNLQITLDLGQVEVSSSGALKHLKTSVLMNLDDIEEVNAMIKKAGAKKLRTMQRLAVFRRQVIYKEWEHKVVCANIDYLKYMLQVIEKCKVTLEFLHILRNWNRVLEGKRASRSVGIIERTIEDKISNFRKNLDRLNAQIEVVKMQILQMKRRSQQVNKQIDDVKVSVAMATANRDVLIEEKRQREQDERMRKIKVHRNLLDSVRRDYAHILELNTILELQRLRTYPTLAPAPPECPTPRFE